MLSISNGKPMPVVVSIELERARDIDSSYSLRYCIVHSWE